MSHPTPNQQIDRAVAILRRGGVVAFPTDTLYGLGASVEQAQGVARVFSIKGRPASMPLPLLLADIAQLPQVASSIPEIAWTLAGHFWPGALTLVLPKAPHISDLITGGLPTVAVRVPNHPIPRELTGRAGCPITGTSANRSGAPPARTAQEVTEQLGDQVDLVIDGGACSPGTPSTVVDCTQPAPRVLREGAISTAILAEVCGRAFLVAPSH